MYPYIYRWNRTWIRPIDRKGQRCRILARGKRNTVALEFDDGFQVVTSAWAIQRASGVESPQASLFDSAPLDPAPLPSCHHSDGPG